MKKKYPVLLTLLFVLFISTGCFRDRKKLEEYRTKLKTAESVLEEKRPIETHNLSVNKRKFGLNERVVIFQNEEPLVAFTFTKVNGNMEAVTDNPDYSDKYNKIIQMDIKYENISYSDPYNVASTLFYNSKGKDNLGNHLAWRSQKGDTDISIGETGKTICSIVTTELVKKIEYITFRYYYPKSLLEGNFSEKDYVDFKLFVEH